MKREELQAKWPTFTIREEPDPACTSCKGAGERRTNSEYHPIVPCWCVLFSRAHYGLAREVAHKVAKKGRAGLAAAKEGGTQ